MAGREDGESVPDWLTYVLVVAGEILVPLALAMVLPLRVRMPVLVGLGVVALAAEVSAAEQQGLVANGGDFTGGWQDWFLVAILNGLHVAPLWAIGSGVGARLRRHRSSPAPLGTDSAELG